MRMLTPKPCWLLGAPSTSEAARTALIAISACCSVLIALSCVLLYIIFRKASRAGAAADRFLG